MEKVRYRVEPGMNPGEAHVWSLIDGGRQAGLYVVQSDGYYFLDRYDGDKSKFNGLPETVIRRAESLARRTY